MRKKKKTERVRRAITRANVRRPKDTGETIGVLHERLANTPATDVMPIPQKPVELPRGRIRVAEKVFQWRERGRNRLPSDDHILELATAIKRGDVMPPITVFPVGRDYYVMDGHHRVAGHDMVGRKTVVANVFSGTLKQAERAALRANNKNKLQMTKSDRTSAAWRLVKQEHTDDSIRTIAEDSGVAPSTVDNMRAVLKKLKEKGTSADDIRSMSWDQARWKAKDGEADYDHEHEDWIEAEADKLVDDILRYKLGTRLTRNTDITALALWKLNEGLPDALMAEWTERAFDPHAALEEDEDGSPF